MKYIFLLDEISDVEHLIDCCFYDYKLRNIFYDK